MAVFIRAKRVTDPLADEARARLITSYYSSSGSDHAAADLSFFSGLPYPFLDADDRDRDEITASGDGSCGDEYESCDRYTQIADTVRGILDPRAKDHGLREWTVSLVAGAAEKLSGIRPSSSAYKRAVMARLRDLGYNAGLCKSRWDRCGGLAGGCHEYIDIVVALPRGEEKRYIVELDFAGEFEIARPTEEYERLVKVLPEMVVATTAEMKEVVRMVAGAARRSIKQQGLHVPPWRKSRYMISKWLGPHRRTVNAAAGMEGAGDGAEIRLRAVGFRPAPGIRASPAKWTR